MTISINNYLKDFIVVLLIKITGRMLKILDNSNTGRLENKNKAKKSTPTVTSTVNNL